MTTWADIATYDAMKKKPELAVFRFEHVEHPRGFDLPVAYKTERYMGSRVCTHWTEFDPPGDGG